MQKFENGESERFSVFLCWLKPGSLSGDQVGEERMQAGGSSRGGQAIVGCYGMMICSLKPKGCCLDVTSDGGACTWMFGDQAKTPMSLAVWALSVRRVLISVQVIPS